MGIVNPLCDIDPYCENAINVKFLVFFFAEHADSFAKPPPLFKQGRAEQQQPKANEGTKQGKKNRPLTCIVKVLIRLI